MRKQGVEPFSNTRQLMTAYYTVASAAANLVVLAGTASKNMVVYGMGLYSAKEGSLIAHFDGTLAVSNFICGAQWGIVTAGGLAGQTVFFPFPVRCATQGYGVKVDSGTTDTGLVTLYYVLE